MPWHEGDLVHKLRRLQGLNVEQLAARADLSPSIIRRLEQGKTRQADRNTVVKIARVFGMSAGEFIDAVPQAAVTVHAMPNETVTEPKEPRGTPPTTRGFSRRRKRA